MTRQSSTSGSYIGLFAVAFGVASLCGVPTTACNSDESASTEDDAGLAEPTDAGESPTDGETPTKDSGDTGAESACTTTITAGQGGTFVELCDLPQGTVKHVTVRGVLTPATHAVAQVLIGFDAPPAEGTTKSASATYAANQLRVLLYGGGKPFPPGIVQPTFGSKVLPFKADASFLRSLSTVCFDVGDGSATAGPVVVVWVDGQNGANCADKSTLTSENAFGKQTDWEGTVGALEKGKKNYFWQSPELTDLPTITLSNKSAL